MAVPPPPPRRDLLQKANPSLEEILRQRQFIPRPPPSIENIPLGTADTLVMGDFEARLDSIMGGAERETLVMDDDALSTRHVESMVQHSFGGAEAATLRTEDDFYTRHVESMVQHSFGGAEAATLRTGDTALTSLQQETVDIMAKAASIDKEQWPPTISITPNATLWGGEEEKPQVLHLVPQGPCVCTCQVGCAHVFAVIQFMNILHREQHGILEPLPTAEGTWRTINAFRITWKRNQYTVQAKKQRWSVVHEEVSGWGVKLIGCKEEAFGCSCRDCRHVHDAKGIDVPGPPSELHATFEGICSVALWWKGPLVQGNGAVATYVVEQRVEGCATWQKIDVDLEREEQQFHTMMTLPAQAMDAYEWRIGAHNKCGLGEWGNIVDISPQSVLQHPNPPQCKLDVMSPSSVVVTWKAPKSGTVVHYVIELCEDQQKFRVVGECLVTRYLMTGLQHNTKYKIRLRVATKQGTSDPGPPVVVSMPSGTPIAPRDVMVDGATATSVVVSWKMKPTTAVNHPVFNAQGEEMVLEEEDSYFVAIEHPDRPSQWKLRKVQVSPNAGHGALGGGHGSPNTRWVCSIDGLSMGQNYGFRVSTQNRYGVGDASKVVRQSTLGLPDRVCRVTVQPEADMLRVQWKPPKGQTAYMDRVDPLYYLVEIARSNDWAQVYHGKDLWAKVGGLHSSTKYQVRVSAVNAQGQGPSCLVSSKTTLAALGRLLWVQPISKFADESTVISAPSYQSTPASEPPSYASDTHVLEVEEPAKNAIVVRETRWTEGKKVFGDPDRWYFPQQPAGLLVEFLVTGVSIVLLVLLFMGYFALHGATTSFQVIVPLITLVQWGRLYIVKKEKEVVHFTSTLLAVLSMTMFSALLLLSFIPAWNWEPGVLFCTVFAGVLAGREIVSWIARILFFLHNEPYESVRVRETCLGLIVLTGLVMVLFTQIDL